MSVFVSVFLWLVFASLVTIFIAAVAVAVFIFLDLLQARRSSWRRWDDEMRQYEAARRVTSQEVK